MRKSGPAFGWPLAQRLLGRVPLFLLALSLSIAPSSEASDFERVAEHPIWRALVHQGQGPLGRGERASFVRDGFFWHPDGGRRPDLELRATVDAFLSPDPEQAQAARCHQPARFAFLVSQGLLKEPSGAASTRGACPEFDAWRQALGDVEVTLIFPESFLGNPASMFGHTLLRFDPRGSRARGAFDPLLGWALDYTADSEGGTGPMYLIRGLAGGYEGRFSLAPYFEKIRFYGDWQDRDIWEYPLEMASEDLERLILHVWELRDVGLPYYFFTQNCSQKLIELLEVAWPNLERGGGSPPAVTPVDTVRAMAAIGETLGTPSLRPSPATELQRAFAALPSPATKAAVALATGDWNPNDERLRTFSTARRARVLELAYDVLRHRYLAGQVSEAESRGRSLALLRARSRTNRGEVDDPVDAEREPESAEHASAGPQKSRPDSGHGTARVELAGGIQDKEGFIEFRIQPAYHSAIDAPGGFAEGGEIRVLDTRLRYFPELERVRLHELVLLDVTTASPWRAPFRPLGWHLEAGLRTRLFSSRDRGLDTEGVFRFQSGIGAAAAPRPGWQLFAFGEFALEAAPGIKGDVALGPLARLGFAYAEPKGRYSLRVETLGGFLTGPRSAPWLRGLIEQRIRLSDEWSVISEGRFEHAYDVGHFEGRLGLTRYF